MPDYDVTDKATGITLVFTGDSPPTDEEIKGVFSDYLKKRYESGRYTPATSEQFTDAAQSPEGSAFGRFTRNFGAAVNPVAMARGLWSAATNLPETATGIWNAQMGQFEKAGEAFNRGGIGGTVEAAGRVAAGALPLVGPAAAAAGDQIASGDVAGGLGAGAGLVVPAVAARPLTQAAGKVLKRPAQATARAVYQSALKPTKSVLNSMRAGTGPDGARRLLIDTGLTEGAAVSPRGLTKVSNLIDSLNAAVQDKLKAYGAQGATIDPSKVDDAIAAVAKDFTDQINAQPDLAAIQAVRDNFATNPSVSKPMLPAAPGQPAQMAPGPIPIETAQRMKVNTYKGLRGKYGRELGGTIEAEKAGARALKEGISTAAPEVAPLNAREGTLIPLEEALADAMRRRGNYGMFGLTPIVAATPAVMSGNVMPLLAALADRMPGLVSRAGIWMNRTGSRSGRIVNAAGKAAPVVPKQQRD